MFPQHLAVRSHPQVLSPCHGASVLGCAHACASFPDSLSPLRCNALKLDALRALPLNVSASILLVSALHFVFRGTRAQLPAAYESSGLHAAHFSLFECMNVYVDAYSFLHTACICICIFCSECTCICTFLQYSLFFNKANKSIITVSVYKEVCFSPRPSPPTSPLHPHSWSAERARVRCFSVVHSGKGNRETARDTLPIPSRPHGLHDTSCTDAHVRSPFCEIVHVCTLAHPWRLPHPGQLFVTKVPVDPARVHSPPGA